MADGVLRKPFFWCTPRLKAEVSAKANSSLWQDAQLMVRVRDNIGSKNNFLPSVAAVAGSGFLNALCEMNTILPIGSNRMQNLLIDFITQVFE
ncbi:MAG: hypothetical protein DI539_23910 [Flavobacterium psychrophilum]|nr:MAG: hypothetical protein DI539_23910 [Flavobacterium psychrophilum]